MNIILIHQEKIIVVYIECILNGNNEGKLGGLSTAINMYKKKYVSIKCSGYYWCFKEGYKKTKQYVNNKTQ